MERLTIKKIGSKKGYLYYIKVRKPTLSVVRFSDLFLFLMLTELHCPMLRDYN